jgi:hypothetical protein
VKVLFFDDVEDHVVQDQSEVKKTKKSKKVNKNGWQPYHTNPNLMNVCREAAGKYSPGVAEKKFQHFLGNFCISADQNYFLCLLITK